MNRKMGRRKCFSVLLALVVAASCSSDSPKRVIVLCAGDSLTEQGYPRLLKALLTADGVRARVLNRGRSGNASKEYLRYLEGNKKKLAAERPDFILLQLGTNDVRMDGDLTDTPAFIENMNRILDIFSGFKNRFGDPSRILLAVIPPIPEGVSFPFAPESQRRVESEINPALARIAWERGLPLVDNHALFLKSPQFLSGVHPTDEGYRLMAGNWHRILRTLMKQPRR